MIRILSTKRDNIPNFKIYGVTQSSSIKEVVYKFLIYVCCSDGVDVVSEVGICDNTTAASSYIHINNIYRKSKLI